MSFPAEDSLTSFQWTPQPAAAAIVLDLVNHFCDTNAVARKLATDMQDETGTRFVDWVDHIGAPTGTDTTVWTDAGYESTTIDGDACYVHRGGIFPTLLINTDNQFSLAILVESVPDFAAVHEFDNIQGEPSAPYRSAVVSAEGNTTFSVVERHGYLGFKVHPVAPVYAALVAKHREIFLTRRRTAANEQAAFAYTEQIVDNAISEIGRDRACDLFFAAERDYWQRRNRAARVQYARQATLGLGWGNDDHHTYRSSRQHFKSLIALFEKLGFFCRERFYAGLDAGWGAQVLEHPVTEIVIFADVDMSAEELRGDFSHEGLPARETLGTIGLWCALHGESVLEAGMHHLECTFDHALLRTQLADARIETMDPFTSFSYLKQAFTRGEIWPVRSARIDALLSTGQITSEQAAHFREQGAIGSHLENLERNDGFKGFNQEGVSEIIAGTDPRRHLVHTGA